MLDLLKHLPTTKQGVQDFIDAIYQEVVERGEDSIQFATAIKTMADISAAFNKQTDIQDCVVRDVQNYGEKELVIQGIKYQVRETGVKYNFSGCGHSGWDDFNKLTYLSHLKKRLENANRAYNSVQVHCFGWTEEQVDEFSRDRALLAPQFAKSLFGRLERGPMQMTSYFMGKDMFMDVLNTEMERLGEAFDVLTFNDVILKAGAVPMDMLPILLASTGVKE